ncbi:uncharacterized protein EDB91DRAFT_1061029 [Suillus paluster]|uniref:uncharacterized protein n=1 Tax=Suillus paluster TaxID=48578 RepID=UPI001B881B75|nr:uncharacterized protein EDB91DRAFT_1061029 [Suillus paluster]KAG1727656.1 hypothetical protein EDB91DRAFT_1061029 [Suillus paluster]
MGGSEQVVTQNQLLLTPAYAFTDYQSQGQTISNAIIDITMPPSGGLSLFNVYVTLSQGHDQRIMKLDQITEQWWDAKSKKL